MIDQIVLVPGFFEPRLLMQPLRYSLRKTSLRTQIWRDRWAFRSLDRSIDRLRLEISAANRSERGTIAIVTHSFGDWVARQAIAEAKNHRVTHLVSIAPIMNASPVAKGLRAIGCGLIPEVPVMASATRASENSDVGPGIRRLILWANLDVWIRPPKVVEHAQTRSLWATHLSIILQPNVHRAVRDFLDR
ncbi:esterase/lipase family protein [Novipirellula artificiosorum]|uniref:Alpha/beta hydrolase family protein n=1 Tax=Novipirellula artificiosorum TaxID=2528016 RepID=A0A5C6DH95_9BACT|nr:hypothetical protein [Novipirellula artificiosorum]TWU35962.1 hypothetical protein Poly41_37140 [Novipirellula artificiosorum]